MFANSEMQKNNTDECLDTGSYSLLASSISSSVFAATACLALISSANSYIIR
jgi:hypothetical protein